MMDVRRLWSWIPLKLPRCLHRVSESVQLRALNKFPVRIDGVRQLFKIEIHFRTWGRHTPRTIGHVFVIRVAPSGVVALVVVEVGSHSQLHESLSVWGFRKLQLPYFWLLFAYTYIFRLSDLAYTVWRNVEHRPIKKFNLISLISAICNQWLGSHTSKVFFAIFNAMIDWVNLFSLYLSRHRCQRPDIAHFRSRWRLCDEH